MDAIYAYLKDLGDGQWVAHPAMNVSTKNIDPLNVADQLKQQAPPPVQTQPVTNPPAPQPPKKSGGP